MTQTPMPDSPSTIIAGMSEAQKRAMMALDYRRPLHAEDLGVSRSVLQRLCNAGLAERVKCLHRYGGGSFTGYALSDLGLSVRTLLKGSDQ